jgi:hypothetical protein
LSRYFYYVYWLSLLINTIYFVPRLLMNERFNGSVAAVMLGAVYGCLCAIFFVMSMNQFPGEGLPDIFRRFFPGWIRVPTVLLLGVLWASGGSLILIAFSMITLRFLSPETNPAIMLLCFCGLGCFAASFRPTAILNACEIVMLVNAPFVFYILYKSITSRNLDWDSILVLSDYVIRKPSLIGFAAASFPFTGYVYLALFNRIFKQFKVKHLWLIPATSIPMVIVTFLAPVGLLGVDSVGEYLYTWITTSDTLRMPFGFIQRVIFLFLFIYIGYTLLYIAICWNIWAILFTESIGKKTVNIKSHRIPVQFLGSLLVAVATLLSGFRTSDKSLIDFVISWHYFRIVIEVLLIVCLVSLALIQRRQRRHA